LNNLNDLLKKDYQIMGTTSTADDAVEMMNHCKKYENFVDVQICRYKNRPGYEDAYAILCLHIFKLWEKEE